MKKKESKDLGTTPIHAGKEKKNASTFANRKIRDILTVKIGRSLIISFVLIIVLVGFFSQRMSSNLSLAELESTAAKYGSDAKYNLDQIFMFTDTLASNSLLLKDLGAGRAELANMLQNYFKNSDSINCIWTMWEPNAFDGKDGEYLNAPYYPNAGYNSMTFYRDPDTKVIERIDESDDEGAFDGEAYYDEDYYTIPKESGKPFVDEPEMSEYYTADDLYEISLVAPILGHDGEFLGVVGMDVGLGDIQSMFESLSPYETGAVNMVFNTGKYITNKNQDLIGAYLENEEAIDSIARGEPYGYDTKAEYIRYVPVATYTTGEFAAVEISAPKSVILAPGRQLVILLSAVCVLVLAVALVILFRIANQIAKPIRDLSDCAQKISEGDMNSEIGDCADISPDSDNEIHKMIYAFHKMMASIKNNVSVVKRIAQGDMTVFVDVKSDQDDLGKSLYSLVQSNDHMYAGMLQIAEKVADGAKQIAAINQGLADGAARQAATMEELASTITQVNEIAVLNEEKSLEANEFSTKVKAELSAGRTQMKYLLTSMEGVVDSSAEISKIIKVIDDIAFQTNILALNAAVEAARAGQAGRGFAVVADEVRNLASKSADAANQTKDLIEASIRKVQDSSKAAKTTVGDMDSIVEQVDKSTELVSEIYSASKEQAQSITQINVGIKMIADSISDNAATTEECAATSVQMESSADVLKGEVDRFNLRKRVPGQPYIPPEKANDSEFVRKATEDYIRFVNRKK